MAFGFHRGFDDPKLCRHSIDVLKTQAIFFCKHLCMIFKTSDELFRSCVRSVLIVCVCVFLFHGMNVLHRPSVNTASITLCHCVYETPALVSGEICGKIETGGLVRFEKPWDH